jgi:NAD(P)-dependent dehydrogenase (short-subunit alcohol dehydrogenase family)
MAVWHRVVDVNLFGVVHGIRAFLPILQQQREGRSVNTASMAGLSAVPTIAPYIATKHAVVGLSESLFLELQAAGSPVGVSVLYPGFVTTDIMSTAPDQVEGAIARAVVDMLRAGVDDGMPASDVARQVVDAIERRQFWILTHDDVRHDPVERMRRAASGDNPVPPTI